MDKDQKYDLELSAEEREKVKKFRRLLYKRMAMALMFMFVGMAIASGTFVMINLMNYIIEGAINVLGILAGISMMIGFIFAAIIAGTAEEVM